MAALSGTAGSVFIGTVQIGELREWNIEPSMDPVDTSAFGDTWAEFIASIKKWTGSAQGNWLPSDAGQTAMKNAFTGGSVIGFAGAYAGGSVSGSALITSMPIALTLDGKGDIEYQLQGTGPLTL